jgi:hypothetical protein
VVSRVLGVAGAAVTLVGVALLLIIAVQRGLFGPLPRVVSGALLAIALVATAHLVHRRQRGNAGAVALAATGYAAGYLDVVAMTVLYRYLPIGVGLALAGAIAVTGLLFARAWDSQMLALVTVVGAAMLSPVLAGPFSWRNAAFLLVLAMAAFPAQLGRDWPAVGVVRTIPSAGALLLGLAAVDAGWMGHAPLTVMAVMLAAFGLTSSTWLVHRHHSDVAASAMVVASALPLLGLPAVLDRPQSTLMAAATAGGYLIGWYAVTVADHGRLPLHLRSAVAAVTPMAAMEAIAAGAPSELLGSGVLVLALAYLGLALARGDRVAAALGLVVGALGLLAYARFLPAVLGLEPLARLTSVSLVDSLLALAVVVAMTRLVRRMAPTGSQVASLATVAFWLGALLASSGAVVSAGVLVGRMLGSESEGFVAGHAAATLLWMSAAAYLLIHGLRRVANAEVALRSGLLLAAVAVGKLLLFDFGALEGMSRVLAFLGTGSILLVMGTGYARALERARRARAGVSAAR